MSFSLTGLENLPAIRSKEMFEVILGNDEGS